MPLPQVKQPTFEETVPSLDKKVKMRRFLVAEEKKLLMAKQSEEELAIAEAVVEVVADCMVSDIDVYQLAPFDLDWLFMRLRAQSVDNIVKIQYTDNRDGGEKHDFEFSLDGVDMPKPHKMKTTIKLDENLSIEVAYPTVDQVQEATRLVVSNETDRSLEDLIVAASIRRVYDAEGEEYTADSEEEIFEYINSFPPKAYKELKQFLDTIPELTHTLTYKNTNDEDKEVVLTGLQDFFTF